jgi:hypothetical protein
MSDVFLRFFITSRVHEHHGSGGRGDIPGKSGMQERKYDGEDGGGGGHTATIVISTTAATTTTTTTTITTKPTTVEWDRFA